MSVVSAMSERPARPLWRHPLILIPLGLIVVLLLAVAALVTAPPTALIRDQLARVIGEATGRELKVAGQTKLTLFPKATFTLQRVSLAGPPDAVGPELVRAESIDGEVALGSLLRGRLDVSKLRIVRPVLTIRPEDRTLFDKLGRGKDGGIGDKADHLVLREVVISDGSVHYIVKQPNVTWRIDQLSATFADALGKGESKGSGNFRWREEKITFNTELADARAYARGQASPLNLKVGVKHLDIDFKGELSPQDDGQIRGALVAKVDSLRDFVRWLDVDPGAYALKGPAAFEGPLTLTQAGAKLQSASLKIDAGESTWDTEVRFKEPRPQVTGNIVWRRLDLQKLMGETPKIPALALEARAPQRGTAIPSAWQALGSQLAMLNASPSLSLSAAANAAPARAERTTWNLEAFDLDGLAAVDLNITTAAEAVVHGPVQMRNARADVLLNEGRLTYTLKQIEIDKGRATGRFDIDSTTKPAKMALSFSATNLPTEAILSQVLENSLLAGDMKADAVLQGRGRNVQEILGSLDGKVNMTIEKGKLIGFNLRRALLEWWRQWSYDPTQRTNFDRIAGNYGISDGVVSTLSDLSMTGPEVQITSSGTVTLPSQTINQKVRLMAFPPPRHLAVPLKVDGSWANPQISWDWLSVLLNPSIAGAPTSVSASPEPIPADVKAAVVQLLNGPNASQLPAQTRELLQSLAR